MLPACRAFIFVRYRLLAESQMGPLGIHPAAPASVFPLTGVPVYFQARAFLKIHGLYSRGAQVSFLLKHKRMDGFED